MLLNNQTLPALFQAETAGTRYSEPSQQMKRKLFEQRWKFYSDKKTKRVEVKNDKGLGCQTFDVGSNGSWPKVARQRPSTVRNWQKAEENRTEMFLYLRFNHRTVLIAFWRFCKRPFRSHQLFFRCWAIKIYFGSSDEACCCKFSFCLKIE